MSGSGSRSVANALINTRAAGSAAHPPVCRHLATVHRKLPWVQPEGQSQPLRGVLYILPGGPLGCRGSSRGRLCLFRRLPPPPSRNRLLDPHAGEEGHIGLCLLLLLLLIVELVILIHGVEVPRVDGAVKAVKGVGDGFVAGRSNGGGSGGLGGCLGGGGLADLYIQEAEAGPFEIEDGDLD